MTPQTEPYARAVALIDAANAEDPNREISDGRDWPKELLYSRRMSDMIARYAPEADEAMRLAVRAQHIERWKTPRGDYPQGRQGYLQWRSGLYKFHGDTAARLVREAGYDDHEVERVRSAVSKRALKKNPDTQLLEDVTALVFIEHYMLDFAGRHPEYDEEKWLGIIRKTWNKMSERAQQFALAGGIRLPEPLLPVIHKALAET